MTAILNTRPTQILLLALTVSATACSGVTNTDTTTTETSTIENDGVKLAYILEKTATPTKWDPDGAEAVSFKHCVQRPPSNEAMIKATYQFHLGEIKFDLETAADAKANNYKVSSSPMKLHSVALINACPSGAIAICDKGNAIEHYYTDAAWVLAEFEKSCGYSGSDIWTKSK